MNLPNKLTVIRILLAPIFLLLLLWEFPFHNLTAGLVFGAAALTRYVRRENRRSRGLITNLGKFLDPLATKMRPRRRSSASWRRGGWTCGR